VAITSDRLSTFFPGQDQILGVGFPVKLGQIIGDRRYRSFKKVRQVPDVLPEQLQSSDLPVGGDHDGRIIISFQTMEPSLQTFLPPVYWTIWV